MCVDSDTWYGLLVLSIFVPNSRIMNVIFKCNVKNGVVDLFSGNGLIIRAFSHRILFYSKFRVKINDRKLYYKIFVRINLEILDTSGNFRE